MVDYCGRGLSRLTWTEYRTERLSLLQAGWTEQSVSRVGVCTFVRFGQRRTLYLVARVR